MRRFFAGLIDEPKVYNKTLTADEAATFSFIKEGDETEAASHFTKVYSTFNEISADATAVVTVKDIAQNSMTMKVHYCDAVTVDMMPYGAYLPSLVASLQTVAGLSFPETANRIQAGVRVCQMSSVRNMSSTCQDPHWNCHHSTTLPMYVALTDGQSKVIPGASPHH
jgi:hypothetical protein